MELLLREKFPKNFTYFAPNFARTLSMHMYTKQFRIWWPCSPIYRHIFDRFKEYHDQSSDSELRRQREIKFGTSSRWSSSLYCSMRNSGGMTIGKTHPTLKAENVPGNFTAQSESQFPLKFSYIVANIIFLYFNTKLLIVTLYNWWSQNFETLFRKITEILRQFFFLILFNRFF